MPTPHNAAQKGDFAKTVLMPGDPLRAKFIAETFLESPKLVTSVRGMLGYTGTYELFTQYDVENIIRIGSAGSYSERAKVYDVVLATAAFSESSFAKTQSGFEGNMTHPSEELNEKLRASAAKLGMPLIEGVIHSSDVFYREDKTPYWKRLRDEYGCLAVEMESFALFHNAAVTGRRAACLLTISDSFVSHEETTAEQRQTTFTNMMEIALGSVLE